MDRIALVINRKAKRHAKDPSLEGRLVRTLGDDGIVYAPESQEALTDVVRDIRRRDIQLVAVAGGDGTNHVTISRLVEAYADDEPLPYFAMLRGGTMNTVAESFGIPRRKPDRLLHDYIQTYKRRALRPLRFVEPNVMRVGSHCGFIFGTGAIYGFINEYNRRPERSAFWAAQVLARGVGSAIVGGDAIKRIAPRWRGEVRFDDGSAFPLRDYLTIGASTCGEIGLGFKPFYRCGQLPDRIHMLGIFARPSRFIRRLPEIARGRTIGADATYEKLARSATLVAADGGPVSYALDGDLYSHPGSLEIRSGPRLRIVVPS